MNSNGMSSVSPPEIPAEVLSSPALLFLYYRLEQIIGIKTGGDALVKLNAHLEKSCGASFVENPAAYEKLLTSREQIFNIAKFLTVNETYFFREGIHFELLMQLLPQLIKLHRPIMVCSAATSIGCEAYSLAMLLDYHAQNGQGFEFEIDAFDVNNEAIEKARLARYTQNSLRKDGSDWKYILDSYLVHDGGEYVVSQRIRKKVHFFPHNIMRGLDKQYDIIFFRNALIYFSPKSRLAVLNNLAESLFPNGLLFLGISETSSVNRPHLINRNFSDAYYFQKAGQELYLDSTVSKDQVQRALETLRSPALIETKPSGPKMAEPDTRKVKAAGRRRARLHVDCAEVAALLEGDEGKANAEKTLDMISKGADYGLSGGQQAAAVSSFLGEQNFKSADLVLSQMEKKSADSVTKFLRGEYYFLSEKIHEAEHCFEEAVAKDKTCWPAYYRIVTLAANGNRTRYEYKVKKAIESIELGKALKYECFMGGFSPDYFRLILEKKLT